MIFFFFYNLFFICIKISNDSSAKYYKDNKERLQKARERHQNLPIEKKKKSHNMVEKVTKISQKMESKSLLSIEKNVI